LTEDSVLKLDSWFVAGKEDPYPTRNEKKISKRNKEL